MKKIYTLISAAVVLFAACEEFQPVFTGKYPKPEVQEPEVLVPTHTIKELADMYTVQGQPIEIEEDVIIAGRVSTTDQPGNFYKSLYIEDGTCGMEIKIGRNGLYNEYKPGQTIYVKCKGLTLGMYGFKEGKYGGMGMVQLGYADPTKEYETSYLEHSVLVERHIVKGPYGDPIEPVELTEDMLPTKDDCQKTNKYVGTYVTIKDLTYADEVFVLLYLDSNKDKKAAYNRVFLSDTNGVDAEGGATHMITTWAMSEAKMKEYLYAGYWDTCKVGSGNDFLMDENGNNVTLGSLKGDGTYPGVEKAAYSVSQYFTTEGGTEIQIRTSGYCKFSDYEIDSSVLEGDRRIDVTGVLTMYQGSLQFILVDLDGVKVHEIY